jgi:leucyl aminopeptidase
MPLHPVFKQANISNTNIADIANISSGRLAGSNTAAEFLHYFAGDVNFIHADIAGSHEFKKHSLAVILKTLFYFAKDFNK